MRRGAVKLGVGTKLTYDGELVEVVEFRPTASGNEVVLRAMSGLRVWRVAVRELLRSEESRMLPVGRVEEANQENDEPVSVILGELPSEVRDTVLERAAHIRELLTGYRSGTPDLPAAGEPRGDYDPRRPLVARYEAKAAELGVGSRTLQRWVQAFRQDGEAGLVQRVSEGGRRVDPRWVETALEVMVEYTDQSRPSRTMVIDRTNARVVVRFGPDGVTCPSRATAFRALEDLERRHPTFRLSTKRNRDIAGRPQEAYGKLRPTRPGEYMLMDTTRLDVFGLDPVTLRWVQAELTVAMDWYTRCILGVRVTPVSTKAIDAAATLYQAYRPPPAKASWPAHAVWPEHGVPRSVLVDRFSIDGPIVKASGPAIVPDTIVVDHGKIYISEHLTSVCQRLGISIQPARLRTGRDKGPVERFFRTVREDLLQHLPGYKGPDVHSRGLDPESQAFYTLSELEDIIREWVATVYHLRPHDGLLDPHLPKMRMSPSMMFEHGMARAGYIEVPPNPDLAYEFLRVVRRTVQHYGVEIDRRRYNIRREDGQAVQPGQGTRRSRGLPPGSWPFHVNPDDISRIYFHDPETKQWVTLLWQHAPSLTMPFSEDALDFARKLAAAKYTYPDDKVALADLLERWNVGLGQTRAERRIALRLAREGDALTTQVRAGEQHVAALPSVTRVLQRASGEEQTVVADAAEVTTAPSKDRLSPTASDVAAGRGADNGDDDQADLDGDFYLDALEDV